ncbi:MAG: phosphohistidine phosphatase SixA [Anaerolineae bacterium]|nr:phosphohistidine phosphatase SixA [Anaerolineae bacterium]
MILYFLRHGEAEDTAADDYQRALTPRGVRRTQAAGRVLAQLKLSPTHIYSSPRQRARQTAEIVAEALGREVEIRDEVNYEFSVSAVEQLISGLDSSAEVMFVGHQPTLSQVIGALTGATVAMKRGGLARVDIPVSASPLRGQLVWLIAPKVFDTLDE